MVNVVLRAAATRSGAALPGCANWLRYGVQPKNPREGMRPGRCTGKAHRRELATNAVAASRRAGLAPAIRLWLLSDAARVLVLV